jgi:hypothetical protein
MTSDASPPPKRPLRRLQFGLTSLFVVTAVAAVIATVADRALEDDDFGPFVAACGVAMFTAPFWCLVFNHVSGQMTRISLFVGLALTACSLLMCIINSSDRSSWQFALVFLCIGMLWIVAALRIAHSVSASRRQEEVDAQRKVVKRPNEDTPQ